MLDLIGHSSLEEYHTGKRWLIPVLFELARLKKQSRFEDRGLYKSDQYFFKNIRGPINLFKGIMICREVVNDPAYGLWKFFTSTNPNQNVRPKHVECCTEVCTIHQNYIPLIKFTRNKLTREVLGVAIGARSLVEVLPVVKVKSD